MDTGNLVHRLTDAADRFQQASANYYTELHDYGTGELYTSTEVHIVTRIEENPGITAAKIAEHTCRTKSAVSQMLSKLIAKGLIYREKDPNNGKQQLLYVTHKGKHLSLCHKAYDEKTIPLDALMEQFGLDTVEKFASLLEYMVEFYQNRQKK